jgi:hypothetical protein
MLKHVLAAGALVLVTAAPALAIAPECGAQLAQLKAELSQYGKKDGVLEGKYSQAEKLCAQGKEEDAQQLAREIREDMGKQAGSGSTAKPSSSSGSDESGED